MERRTYVRVKLAEFRLTQTWLAKNLEARGVSADAAEISKALSGELNTPKAREIVARSVEIVNDFETERG